MTTVQACRGCARLFSFLPRGLCAGCIDHRESQYQLVRDWLGENQGRTISVVAQGSGVEQKLISEFIAEGRLKLISDGSAAAEEQRGKDALRARIASAMAMGADAPSRTGPTTGTPAPSVAPDRHSGMRSRS